MILHCSKNLAAKLADVSPTPLEETSPLGSWHGHLFTLDRRQCVMFCHDASRYVLFQSGLRKAHFAELGDRWFRPLYLATLAGLGCSTTQLRKAELALGPRSTPALRRMAMTIALLRKGRAGGEVSQALQALFRLHAKRWSSAGVEGVFDRNPRERAFFPAAKMAPSVCGSWPTASRSSP